MISGDGDAGGDDRTRLPGGVAQVEGDHPHAAPDVSPHAGHPAETAGGVVEADGCRAGVEGAGVGTDHTLAEDGDLQALVGQVVLHELGHGPVVEDVAGFGVGPEALVYLGLCRRVADPQVAFASRPQGIAEAADDVGHGAPALHILRGEAADLGLAAFVVVPELDARPVEEGDEEAVDRGRPLEAAGGKVELLDHQRVKQAGEVGAG